MSQVFLIYTAKDTPRIQYIFSLFFGSLLKTSYKLTTDSSEYTSYIGPKLNYSEKPIAQDEVFIHAAGLLFDTGINRQYITVTEWQGLKVFYQTEGSALPFDIFASSFYLISRYEEYLATSYDQHRRFKAMESLAFKNHFIDVPIVNLWVEELKKILLQKYPSLEISENKYTFIPTVDIDVAYAHKGRSTLVTIGSYLKALAKFDFSTIRNKTGALRGSAQDDYDTYEYQQGVFARNNVNPLYFLLAGERSEHDKNIEVDGELFAGLIKKISIYAEVGIHPSYSSASRPEIVSEEVNRVQKNLSNKISKSRQHFLKVILPDTYRCLAKIGITDDYSMAYASCPGFRTGICTPYYFYDLQEEKTLPVKIHTTAIMDGTMNKYLGISPDEGIALTEHLIDQVKKVNGEFIFIWHNDTLNDSGDWKGWRRVFETMTEYAK